MTYRPLRIRIAARINTLTSWLIRHAPRRVNEWLHGDDMWQPRFGDWIAVTVCAWLGHDWDVVSEGSDTVPSMFMCQGCTRLWTSDDWGDCDPDTRDGRDRLVLVATDYLPRLEERHDRFVHLARQLLEAHRDAKAGVPADAADTELWDRAGLPRQQVTS